MEAEALQGRCFYCSSPEHWANSCPIKLAHKAEEKAQAGGSIAEKAGGKEPKGKGKGNGGKTGSRVKNLGAEETPSAPPLPKVAATAVGSNDPTSALASKAGPTLGPSQVQLVQEATEVLRSLRLKKVTGPGGDSHVVRQVVSCQGFGLIDSGATSALRQGTRAELESAVPVEVQLAVGSTTMHVNAQGTLLTSQPVQPILPMAALPRLGCTIQWSDVGLSVRHPTCGLLPVRLNDTSPELPAPLLLRLIGDYEQLVKREVKDRQSRERLWKVLSQVASDVVDPQAWLEHHVRAGTLDATSLHVWVRAAFPELPERIASRIACEPCCEPERVPFNRRTRRKMMDRAVPTLVSLFSGVQQWSKWPGQVVQVDLLKGGDLLSSDVFGLLLQAAARGSLDGLTAGPPCRTMSVLRMKQDDGPRQVRNKYGPERFGRSGLSAAELASVDDDTVLVFRTFLLMALIQASAAVWQKPRPLFFLEQPAVPSEYAPESPSHVHCPSLWVWPEAERMWSLLGGWVASFDQGPLGHARRKPTMAFVTSWSLYEAIHEVRGAPTGQQEVQGTRLGAGHRESLGGSCISILGGQSGFCLVSPVYAV